MDGLVKGRTEQPAGLKQWMFGCTSLTNTWQQIKVSSVEFWHFNLNQITSENMIVVFWANILAYVRLTVVSCSFHWDHFSVCACCDTPFVNISNVIFQCFELHQQKSVVLCCIAIWHKIQRQIPPELGTYNPNWAVRRIGVLFYVLDRVVCNNLYICYRLGAFFLSASVLFAPPWICVVSFFILFVLIW